MARREYDLQLEDCTLLSNIYTAMRRIEQKVGEKPSLLRLCSLHLDALNQHARDQWGNKGSMLGTRLYNRQVVQEELNGRERCLLCEELG